MEKFDIVADQRLIARLVRAGTQGNAIRALLELVVNCDDSYRRMEGRGEQTEGLIELLYGKDGTRGQFRVRDRAEGMSNDEIREAFLVYGAATSGLKEGKSVAGFFGTGAKNALAGMTNGRMCTFQGGSYSELRVFLEGDSLKGMLEKSREATEWLRLQHGIPGNGTVAEFEVDPAKGQTVPRFETVHGDLANHWRLRKIMTNPRRSVYLIDVGEKGKKRRLHYTTPRGEKRFDERLRVQCGEHGDFAVRVSIFRAESELKQDGDDRQGGILIIDEQDVVLDMSLFKYDHEGLAARLFGEARFEGFRGLLAKEELVLDEKREGLNTSHPVCRSVITAIEGCIGKVVEEEKRRQKELRSRLDDEERTRYRDAFKIMNEIAEEEREEVNYLGERPNEKVSPPPDGFGLYPGSAHVTVGKRYGFEVRIDTTKFAVGRAVRMSSSSARLGIVGNPEFKIDRTSDGSEIMRRFVTVRGTEAGVRATLSAAIGKEKREATVLVEAEKEEDNWLYKHGMVFHPESLTVRMNRSRRAVLRVYVKIVKGGSTIRLTSDQESIHVQPEEIVVDEGTAARHVVDYEVDVWGDEVEVEGLVMAETEGSDALLEVKTRGEVDPPRPPGQGMFSGEPYFDQEDPEPLQRSVYSRETGMVTIYANFPSVRCYLGEDLRYRKSLAAQVLLADLIAERCFFEMARTRKRDVAISPAALPERIQRDAQELSKKHGVRVHKALVDQSLVRKDREAFVVEAG